MVCYNTFVDNAVSDLLCFQQNIILKEEIKKKKEEIILSQSLIAFLGKFYQSVKSKTIFYNKKTKDILAKLLLIKII